MKLPGQIDFGVQSLGRPDKGAMRDKANAEQQAALAWGEAIATIGNEVARVAEAEGLADANLTLSERVAMDKKSIGELDAYLANTPTVNLADEDIPEAVRQAAKKMGVDSGVVDTYLIAEAAAETQFEKTRRESYSAIDEKDQSKKATTSYNKQMDNVWVTSAKSAKQTNIIQRIQHLSSRADVLYNEALNQLDEAAMIQIVIEAEQNGIWTPEYASTKFNAIGATVDQVTAVRMYRDAETQGEIDAADDFTDYSRVDPAARNALSKTSVQQQDRMYKLSLREQAVNYGDAHAMLIRNELTKPMIADMLDAQKLSGAQANTLSNALDTPSAISSDQRVFSDLMGEAISLRFASSDMDPESVRDRARKARENAQMAFTGVGPAGATTPRTITGDDFGKLMDEIDKQENTALGKGGLEYGVAAKQLRLGTGYSDQIEDLLGGKHPAARAYNDATTALQDYMNANPGTANPLEWVSANIQKYSADKYNKAYSETLSEQFPQYKDAITDIVTGSATMVGDAQWKGGVTAGALLNRARMDALNGVIDWSDFERLRRGLQYKYEANDITTGASEAYN